MKRGEIWSIAGGADYAGKPRPAVLIQDDSFEDTHSIVICPFTTSDRIAPLFRLAIEPDEENGLRLPSRLMVDKLSAVPRTKLGSRIGRLAARDLLRLNQAVVVFLGLASSRRMR